MLDTLRDELFLLVSCLGSQPAGFVAVGGQANKASTWQ